MMTELTPELEIRAAHIIDKDNCQVLYYRPSEKLIVLGKIDFILKKIYFSHQLNKLDPLAKFNLGKFIGPEAFYVVGGASAIEQIKKSDIMKSFGSPKMQGLILSSQKYQSCSEAYNSTDDELSSSDAILRPESLISIRPASLYYLAPAYPTTINNVNYALFSVPSSELTTISSWCP